VLSPHNLDNDVPEYLKFCDDRIVEISKLEKLILKTPSGMACGLFHIYLDNFLKSVRRVCGWARIKVQRGCLSYLQHRVQSLNAMYSAILSLPEPSAFEKTKKTAETLIVIKSQIPDIESRILNNMTLKNFIESQHWEVLDDDCYSFYRSCTYINQIREFISLREEQVKETYEILRQTIGKEINTFFSLWATVESAMDKLFVRPRRRSSALHDKKPVSKPLISTIDESKTDAALAYILKHISNCVDIAQVLSKKIECLENVPKEEELKRIWHFMTERKTIIHQLIFAKKQLKEWRSIRLLSLNVTDAMESASNYMKIFMETDLIYCTVVKNVRMNIQQFLEIEAPFILQLQNSIFQVDFPFINFRIGIGKKLKLS
jgi:hypothetical protein